jgi:RNA polymerase sigma-70 factor (ECF subfamily)
MEVILEDLLERWQQGDADAVDALVDHLSPLLRRFFLGLDFDANAADDLVQDTWLRLHRALPTYRPGAPALPWIYAIARHTRLDSLRKRARVRRGEVAMDVLPEVVWEPAPPGEEPLPLGPLLAELPASQREAVVLTKLQGMSLEEAARATGSSVGAVKQKVFRAYEKIRALARERGLR